MSDFIQIFRDAENGLLCLRHVDGDGLVMPELPQVQIKLGDLEYATQIDEAHAIEAYLRRVHYTDPNDGLKKRCYGLFTIPEDDETDDGHSSDTEDLYLGGGAGGGPTIMKVVSYHMDATNGDYLICTQPGGLGNVNVAVEPQLQSSITTQTMPDASVWTYSAYTQATEQRTATCGDVVLTEYITPPFLNTDYVAVFNCANAGATVEGVAVTRVAITGRQWASPSV